MNIEIIEINKRSDIKRFINFAFSHYSEDKHYIAEPISAQMHILGITNPFLKHSEIKLWMAMGDKVPLGRIVAIYNRTHAEIHNPNEGFFGFFESVNNINVAELLFSYSENWLKTKGISTIIGPTNLTTNDSCGVLVEGHQLDPVVMMPYSKPYYNQLLIDCGFEKAIDLYSYSIDGTDVELKYGNLFNRIREKVAQKGITIRHLDREKFEADIINLMPVYNITNQNNWAFMPLNRDEFLDMARQLKRTTPLSTALIAEQQNRIIGYLIAIPDLNQIFKHIPNGKLLPTGFMKYLYYKNKVNNARILILGILPEFKNIGLDLLLYKQIKAALNNLCIFSSEACYVLENNIEMNSILSKIGGEKVKTYRIYKKELVL